MTLSAGHLFTDLNQGALPAMLPFLVAASGINYAQAAGLAFALSLASSLTQPVFGFMADRITESWLLPLGVLLAGCGLSVIGFFPNSYPLMFIAALISGIGIAAYHPEGARMANRLSGEKKTGTMSIFTTGGTVGMGIGPLVVVPSLVYLGLRGSIVLALPAILMFIVLLFLLPQMKSLAETKEREAEKTSSGLKNEWLKFLWLSTAIAARSVINSSMNVFIPLYWTTVLLQSKGSSGMILSFMIFLGAVVIFVGGYLADRFGMNKIIKIGWVILIPSIFFLPSITNHLLVLLMLIPITAGSYMVNTPLIVLGQSYLPKSVGFASGITLGLGVSIGGLMAPLLGSYADVHGLTAALRLLLIPVLLGTLVAFTSRAPASASST